LTVRADIEDLDAAIARYRQRNGRPPRALLDLVEAGDLKFLPQDPEGKPYDYDAARGSVSSAAARVLGS
jgi:hypothetical protein